jgi:UDP-N-acetylmuramate--alanine ligase
MPLPKKAYFIGIGGIGMSALAQMMLHDGADISGSDREGSPVTELLERKGIRVVIRQKAENVPTDADVVVYSDSVPESNAERVHARELGIPSFSYFQMLGKISEGKRTVAVSGTHGKTTTTGMVAKILQDAGASLTAIVGGIVRDFGSNYLHGDSDLFVVEACEYKNNFRFLAPHVLVVTNIEWDHTDFYSSLANVQSTFRSMMEKVPAEGAIVTDTAHQNIAPLLSGLAASVIDYTKEPSYEIHLPGTFNQNNARAAAAAARAVLPTISETTIVDSLAAFHGTWRRFEYKGKTKNGADVYDDYAHHPTAIRVTLKALREKVKGKIFVAFHPHLYSRTRDLLDEFAVAFSDADQVFIAPIYAAREVDDGTISSEILAERIRATGTAATALDFDAIEKALGEVGEGDTIMTMGAGDIYKVADKLVAHTKE